MKNLFRIGVDRSIAILLPFLLLITVGSDVYAQTQPACFDLTNVACANGAQTANQDVSTIYNFKGSATIFTADGATANANKITIALTGDPAGSFNVKIPVDANSATAKSVDCTPGNHLDAFDATTGGFACTADTSGTTLWSDLGNPNTDLSLSMGTNKTTFTWGVVSGAGANTMFDITDGTSTATGGDDYLFAIHTGTSSTLKPVRFTAGGTANGVEMSTAGLLAKIGSGSIEASDVACTGCVGTADVAANSIDGTKIALTSNATGDLMYYDGTDWTRLAVGSSSEVLHGGTNPTWGGISSSDIGAGDLANALVWNTSCTASPCTLPSTPRTADTALVVYHTLTLRRVASCGGINEYTLSGTTLTFCGTAPSTGADAALVTYEL